MPNKTKRDLHISKIINQLELDPKGSQIHSLEDKSYLDVISHYEKTRQFDKAIEIADIAINRYKFRVDFYLAKAKLLMASNKANISLDVLDQASNISPYELKVHLLRSKALCMLGIPESALEIIEEVKHSFLKADKTEILITEAFIQESMKDYTKMFYMLKEALINDPTNHDALEQIWLSVELTKKYDESIHLHLAIIDQEPYSFQAWYNLGHAYSCLGEYEKSIEALEYSYMINKDFEQAYLDCAEICYQIKNYTKALDIYSEAISLFGPDGDLMVILGDCLIKVGRYKEAKQRLKKAIQIEPLNDEAYFFMGECFAKEGNWNKAIESYKEAILIEDRQEDYFVALANSYVQIQDLKHADIYFKKATIAGAELSQYWAFYLEFLLLNEMKEKFEKTLIKAEKKSFGADILYCKAAYHLKYDEQMSAGITVLEEALREDFSLHKMLFNMLPELQNNKEISAMIRYFEGEMYN